MSVTVLTSKANPGDHNIELVVEVVSSTVLVVRAGDFVSERVQYTLAEDQEWVLPVIPKGGMWVEGYLVVDKNTGNPHVFVDEMVSGEPHYEFGPSSPYTLLATLFSVNIPEGSVSLTGLDLSVFHIVPYPEI